jgi:lipid-A-disaccharide synthase
MHRLGIPVVYYVSPQLWAWRPGRMAELKRHVSRMLVIFPFEEALYREAGVPVAFVGHPLVDLARPESRADFLRRLGVSPERDVVAVLPGSRPKEIAHNLPGLAGAIASLHAWRPELEFLLPLAPAIETSLLEPALRGLPVRLVPPGGAQSVLAACQAAMVASGTATVEAAILGAPMVVVYRLSPLTHFLGRWLVNVPHVAMVNLIAGKRAVPELIQRDFTPEGVASEVRSLLEQPERREAMTRELDEVRRRLWEKGASRRAAKAVADILAVGRAKSLT